MWEARRCTVTKPFHTVVNIKSNISWFLHLFLWAGKLSHAAMSADSRAPGTKVAKCWRRLSHAAPCSCGSGVLFMDAAGSRKRKALSNEGQRETLPPPPLLYPQPCSVRSWKTVPEPGPEPNNWRVQGPLRPQGAQGKLLKGFFPQAEGKAPVAGPQLATAAGRVLASPRSLWGDREGGRGRAATEGTVAGILLSEMAPQASLLPLAGEVPPPQESPNCLSWIPLRQVPLFWDHLRGSGHLLALQVLALPCPTSPMEVAAFPSSPWRPTPRKAKRLFSRSLSSSSHPNPAGQTGSPQKLLEAASRGCHSCGCDLQSCWRSWGEHPRRAEQGGEGWGAMLVPGAGEAGRANFQNDNIGIWGEISRRVAAFLQSLMDLFRRSTAVGGNYTLAGRQCSKIKRRGKAKIKNNHKLFNKAF